ncbi:MAG TPA: hypothetical protein VFC34_12885, partial [Puia sp.]|nr:hypothetical protein [Puia sp.]
DYFKVGLQDLLHADLQKKSLPATDKETVIPSGEAALINAYAMNEAGTSVAQDASQDSFWLILRELRSLNEKLDALKLNIESGSRISFSDKSNH